MHESQSLASLAEFDATAWVIKLTAPEYDFCKSSKALATSWRVGGTMKDFFSDVFSVDEMSCCVTRRKNCGRSAPLLVLFEGQNSAEKVAEPFF